MKRNFLSRLLHRGRKLFNGRRRRSPLRGPAFLGLEALEDRRVMSAGFAGVSLFQRSAPLTIEITIQRPVVVAQPSVSTFNNALSDAGLASLLGALGLNSSSANSGISNTNTGSNSGGLLGNLLNPVTSTVDDVVSNVVTPVVSSVGSVLHDTQPTTESVATSPTVALPVTLPLLPTILVSQPQPALLASVTVAVSTTVSTPAPARATAALALSSGASSTPLNFSTPDTPLSNEVPSAPTDAAPVAPPAVPDPIPGTPALPPGVSQPMEMSRAFPLTAPPTISALAGPAQLSRIDFAALLFGPGGSALPAATETPAADSAAPAQNLDVGRIELSVGSATLSGGFADLEAYVFADVGAVSGDTDAPLAGTTDVPLPMGDHNDVTPPQAPGEAATLIGVSDEVFTRVAQEATQKISEAGKDLLKPSANHWMRYVAPLFMAAGAYFATRFSRRKTVKERQRLMPVV